MGSIEKRIEALEGLVAPPEDEGEVLRALVYRGIMEEFGRLRGCRANRHYRGGTPPTPIQPTDSVGDALGYPYTQGELVAFAARRFFEGEGTPEVFGREGTEALIVAWTELFERRWAAEGEDWDAVEAPGPPEPTPAWGAQRHGPPRSP